MREATLALALLAAPSAAETLRCAPEHPVFCANLHVGCAGRSTRPASAFTIKDGDERALLRFEQGGRISVAVNRTRSGAVYRPKTGRWWIRVDPGGRFSHRVYIGARAVMSVGTCTRD